MNHYEVYYCIDDMLNIYLHAKDVSNSDCIIYHIKQWNLKCNTFIHKLVYIIISYNYFKNFNILVKQ